MPHTTPPTLLNQISHWFLYGFTALLIFFVLPITDDSLGQTKGFTLLFGALLTLVLFISTSFRQRAVRLVLSPLTVPLCFFGIAIVLSTFLTSPYPVEGLLGFGGTFLALVLIALLAPSLIQEKQTNGFITFFGGVGAVLTGVTLLQNMGAGPSHLLNQLFGVQFPHTAAFHVSGAPLIGAQVIGLGVIGVVAQAFAHRRIEKTHAVLLPILLIGLVMHLWLLLPGKPGATPFPSLAASWSVALDTLRMPKSALIGVGPAGYPSAYTRFKPQWVNTEPIWDIQFFQAANTPLTTLTIFGTLGLIAWSLVALAVVRLTKTVQRHNQPFVWMLAATLVLQVLIPTNVILLGLQAIFIAILVASERHRFAYLEVYANSIKLYDHEETAASHTRTSYQGLLYLFTALAFAGVMSLIYLTGKAYAAHYYMAQAQRAAAQNNGIGVYENQQRAVTLNPYLDSLRRQYGLTNILIAAALSEKTNPSQEEQEEIAVLLRQAVREATSATLIDPEDTLNWVTLAQIYQNLMPVDKSAADQAIQAYLRAIQTDPNNPNLRIQLGSVFLSQNQYLQAAQLFEQATQLKSNHPNAYYNLAVALKNLKQLEQAKSAYQNTLLNLQPDSEDYVTVNKELEELEKLIATSTPSTPSAQKSILDAETNQPLTQPAQPGTQQLEGTAENKELLEQTDLSTNPSPPATPSAATTP